MLDIHPFVTESGWTSYDKISVSIVFVHPYILSARGSLKSYPGGG